MLPIFESARVNSNTPFEVIYAPMGLLPDINSHCTDCDLSASSVVLRSVSLSYSDFSASYTSYFVTGLVDFIDNCSVYRGLNNFENKVLTAMTVEFRLTLKIQTELDP
ncbi:hypothetical protein HZH66_010491 [Vespula vulgaris]|uniref:Uncharacterized protein n=1 Tax=Vespula vulgaris TaxID=7454 RepID=A0A834JLZ8_VESVU|nr:hypothetical protein HZH66_010491 [Vespula vulgaris]